MIDVQMHPHRERLRQYDAMAAERASKKAIDDLTLLQHQMSYQERVKENYNVNA